MRILHIIQRYWPTQGGAEVYLREISTRLVGDGHSVTVATTDAGDFEYFWNPRKEALPSGETQHHNVRILRFPVRHLPAMGLIYPAIRRLLLLLSECPVNATALQFRLARFTPWVPELWHWLETTDEPFDLVAGMTICFEPLLEAGLRFAQRRGIPFVIYPLTHLGAGEEPGKDSLSRFYTMSHQIELVRQSDAVIAQTPAERDFYLQHGVPPERIHVIGPGVNPDEVLGGDGERFRKRHELNGPIVFTITKMSYNKGVMHTIEAMARLWSRGCTAHLVLAGDMLDPFRRYFQGLPEEVRKRILLLGTIGDEEKRDLLAAGDVLVMPSRTDSFGIVYLEAWLYGKPVIGAQAWGITDVIEDGKDGLLVPFGDIEALAEAIAYLLDHPEKAAAMGQRGRAKVLSQHTWDRKYPQIREVYLQLACSSI
ncbi:MAG TPA: glycosyltransferase family 1 protein, partial [Chloroflexi bacterium]|nr:glycosyltransferase family 1 protein [Chloroflexota bacterium]